ncbi:MAG: hypothetical protein EOO09_10270 [Chitinophagaceae bacterium]|nr:MAG: hypothetical protein EOO09_10270 [Chitinophagaceae bacterium]
MFTASRFKFLLPYIEERLSKSGYRHQVELFPSDAVMVDVWFGGQLYIIQIYDDVLGISRQPEGEISLSNIPDRIFRSEPEFKLEFEELLHSGAERKLIVIDGSRFTDEEGFYDEADRVLTRDLNWQTGHNMDAFNDLLRGGFGVADFFEPVTVVWKDSARSKAVLKEMINGSILYELLAGIIREHPHIDFIEA